MMGQIHSISYVINQYIKDTVLIVSSFVWVLFGILMDSVYICTSFQPLYLIFLTFLIHRHEIFSLRSKDHFTGPRWSYSAICENAIQKTLTIFFIKMCIFFTKNVLQFCKISKIRVKANLFKSKEKKSVKWSKEG